MTIEYTEWVSQGPLSGVQKAMKMSLSQDKGNNGRQ